MWEKGIREKGGGNVKSSGRGGKNRDFLGDRRWVYYENILQYLVIFVIEKDRVFEKSIKMYQMENIIKLNGVIIGN